MNRQQKRDMQFGRAPVPERVRPKCLDLETAVIELPVIQTMDSVLIHMTPLKEIPEQYYTAYSRSHGSQPQAGTINTVDDYACVLNTWFFGGLTSFKPTLRDGVSGNFMNYLCTIMQDFAPRQEHKMSYLVYLIDKCCVSVDWAPK